MKNIIVIGDLHGKNVWKTFGDIGILLNSKVTKPKYDYYIFLGDYVDAFNSYINTNQKIRDNLLDLIDFKKSYPDNVILLWGNHELHYVLETPWHPNGIYRCSGYRPEAHFDLYEIFNRNFNLFQLAFQYKKYLFTHAGVHSGWYQYSFVPQFKELSIYLDKIEIDYNKDTLADKLNTSFIHRMDAIFDIGHRRGGRNKVGGPLWLDKELGSRKYIDNYHQIAGHTSAKRIQHFNKNKNTSITYIDCLNNCDDVYIIYGI